MPFLVAAVDWFGITLPRQSAVIPALRGSLHFAGLPRWLHVHPAQLRRTLRGPLGRHAESALRTIAALRILDAAELAHALDYLHAHEAAQRPQGVGRIIEAEAREIQK